MIDVLPSPTDKCQRGREPVIRGDGSIEIPLTKGQVAVVDAGGYQKVRDRLWCAYWGKRGGGYRAMSYVSRDGRHKKFDLMHRVITSAGSGVEVDHINHNALDNRGENLRLVTSTENHFNMRKRSNGGSRFKGVSWHKYAKKWRANIKRNRKQVHLGFFVSEEDAARAYDRAAAAEYGEFAFTNEMAGLL